MIRSLPFSLLVLSVILGAFCSDIFAQKKDSIPASKTDSLRFPLRDRRGDPFTWHYDNPFDLSDTSIIKRDIEYDPKTKQYYIVEKIGNTYFRNPTSLTFDEFMKLQSQQAEDDYFSSLSRTLFDLNRKKFQNLIKKRFLWKILSNKL